MTTKVAVRSNRSLGRPEFAVGSAERGLALLDSIAERMGPEASAELTEGIEAARAELLQLLETDDAVAFSVGDDSALPEDVDVGPKLRS